MIWFDKCIVLFGCIIEVFLLFDYFRNFFEFRLKKKTIIIIFITICIVLFGINMIKNATVNLIMFPLLMWIFVSVLFESRPSVRIEYFVTAYIVMIGVEFLFLILSQTISKLLLKTGVVPVSDYGWQIVVVKFINFIAFLILKQTSDKSYSKMTNKLFFTYLCVPIATLGIMITIFYSGVDFARYVVLRIVMTLFFIFMLLGNMVLFYAFQKHTEDINESTRREVALIHKNAEIERLTKIAEINDDYSEVVHNMTHSLKVIGQLAIENNVENIREIVEELTGRLIQQEIYEYSNHKMINTILFECVAKAEKNKIKFDVYVEPGCIIKQVKDIDIVSMFGNILDNAFEAASKGDHASVVFRMFMHEKGKMCIIKVVNDYVEDIIEKNGIIQTTKKEKGIHGIGLKSIAKTVEKYEGSFSYYTENKKFYAILILPVE